MKYTGAKTASFFPAIPESLLPTTATTGQVTRDLANGLCEGRDLKCRRERRETVVLEHEEIVPARASDPEKVGSQAVVPERAEIVLTADVSATESTAMQRAEPEPASDPDAELRAAIAAAVLAGNDTRARKLMELLGDESKGAPAQTDGPHLRRVK